MDVGEQSVTMAGAPMMALLSAGIYMVFITLQVLVVAMICMPET